MPPSAITAISLVPPPTSTTREAIASSTGSSAPMAPAIASSIRCASRAPADSVASTTASRSTPVRPLGTQTITARRSPLPPTMRMNWPSICSVVSKSAITLCCRAALRRALLAAGEAEVQEPPGVGIHVRRVEDDRDQPPAVLRGGRDEAPARLVRVARLDAVGAGVQVQEEVVVDVDLGVRGSRPAHVDLLRPHEPVEARVAEGVPGEGREVPRRRVVAVVADPGEEEQRVEQLPGPRVLAGAQSLSHERDARDRAGNGDPALPRHLA